jgi:mono/diheme cytochrome c family protein
MSGHLARSSREPTDTLALGEYLAKGICSMCHGSDLRGEEAVENQAPNLSIAAAFSLEGFTQVLREGIGLGGRELIEMKEAADSFKHLTDAEIAALHSYLRALPPEDTAESGASQS